MDVLKYIDINPEDAKKRAQKLHIKKDDLSFIKKDYVVEKIESNENERSITARVSTSDRDRDGEIVQPKGIDLKAYQENPVLLWAHKYSEPPVGKALWSKADDSALICKFQFAKTQFADDIYYLYREGFLKTFSIGFIPLDFDTKEKIHNRTELLEVSCVPIPSNSQAQVLEAYQKGFIKSPKLLKDLEIEIEDFQKPQEEVASMPVEVDIEEKIEIMTKPETTDNYHRIPVSEGHDNHRIRTITISEEKGIKALYCGECKVIVTYLFDVDKWSMEEAKKWVKEHKDDKAVEETEVKEPVTIKTLDLRGNPSVNDIACAINCALNPTDVAPGPILKSIWDLYPINYPDGQVITLTNQVNGTQEYLLYNYKYADGMAALSENPISVIPGYRKRTVEDDLRQLKEQVESLKKENADLSESLAAYQEPPVPPEPEKKEEKEPEINIEIGESDINKDEEIKKEVAKLVIELIKSGKFKKMMDDSYTLALAKIKGRVI